MDFSVTASIPIGFSSLFLLVELCIRYVDSQRQHIPCLLHCQYIIINFGLWLFCVALSAVALEMRLEAVSVLSFQLVWIQAAVLKIYHLRRLLFEPLQWSRSYGVLGLTSTACLQCVGAGLCIWDAAPGPTPYWVKCALVPTLHIGWGLHYITLSLWVVWICSVKGTKSEHIRKWRTSYLLITPLFISALVGAIPLSVWYPPKTTFLIFCTVQSLLCTVIVVSVALTKATRPQLGSRKSENEDVLSQDNSVGESTRELTLFSCEDESGAESNKYEVKC